MAIIKYIETNFISAGNCSTKTASPNTPIYEPAEITNYIKNLKPDPRMAYIHLIAMSDSNHYGKNLNHDLFKASELTGMQNSTEADKNPGASAGKRLQRFKTFEHSKFYRNHANSPFDKHYGDVGIAAWNDVMKRVELVVRVYKENIKENGGTAAPDIVEEFERNGYISVSMGCRIGAEVCTKCGHRHPTIEQRCDCLKRNIGDILPDGRVIAADNIEPRFFDISKVKVAADPIAQSLQKVASLNLLKTSRAETVFDYTEPKLSSMVKYVPAKFKGKRIKHTPNDMSPETVEGSVKKAGFEGFVGTATALGIVLSPTELTYAALLNPEANFKFAGLLKFSTEVAELLQNNVAERSGYFNIVPETGWAPEKVASVELADLYSLYRNKLDEVTFSQLSKVANENKKYLNSVVDNNNIYNALSYFSVAGLIN